jgi:hypothetical protein
LYASGFTIFSASSVVFLDVGKSGDVAVEDFVPSIGMTTSIFLFFVDEEGEPSSEALPRFAASRPSFGTTAARHDSLFNLFFSAYSSISK